MYLKGTASSLSSVILNTTLHICILTLWNEYMDFSLTQLSYWLSLLSPFSWVWTLVNLPKSLFWAWFFLNSVRANMLFHLLESLTQADQFYSHSIFWFYCSSRIYRDRRNAPWVNIILLVICCFLIEELVSGQIGIWQVVLQLLQNRFFIRCHSTIIISKIREIL